MTNGKRVLFTNYASCKTVSLPNTEWPPYRCIDYKSAVVNINIHYVDKVSNINGKIRVKSWKNKFFL